MLAAAIKAYTPTMQTYLKVACEAIGGWTGRPTMQSSGYDRLVSASV
jgi:hypothetical protein